MIEFKDNVASLSNERLCEIIVAFRYLGILQEEAVLCMEELALRRANGDQFDYEFQIESSLSKLPKFNLDLSKVFRKRVL